MFGLLQPNKEKVGGRLKQVKDELNISFTEFGNRLGLKKPTISSYVQGYNLAPIEVIEKVAKISDRSVGWFYFGDIDEYIADYLTLKGQGELIKDYPDVIKEIKNEFFNGEFKNLGWENEIGYPEEEFIDDFFADILPSVLDRYVGKIVVEEVEGSDKVQSLTETERNDALIIVYSEVIDYVKMSGEIKYGDKKEIVELVYQSIKNLDVNPKIEFSEKYLIGKLVNVLNDDKKTEKMISDLSEIMTGKSFSTLSGGQELVEIFQTMRPRVDKITCR